MRTLALTLVLLACAATFPGDGSAQDIPVDLVFDLPDSTIAPGETRHVVVDYFGTGGDVEVFGIALTIEFQNLEIVEESVRSGEDVRPRWGDPIVRIEEGQLRTAIAGVTEIVDPRYLLEFDVRRPEVDGEAPPYGLKIVRAVMNETIVVRHDMQTWGEVKSHYQPRR